MPLKKKGSRKNIGNRAHDKPKVPTKDNVYQKHGTVHLESTAKEQKRRITAITTAGKKKKPK